MRDRLTQFVRYVELLPDGVGDRSVYPFSIPAVAGLEQLQLSSGVTFFVGENGSGKSTLIEAIAVKAGFQEEGGSLNFGGSRRPGESELHQHIRLVRGAGRQRNGFFLRAETMFNVATAAEGFGAYGMENLHAMSHGEAFLNVAMERFRPNGLYIMDEPEAALSPQRQLTLLARIHQLVCEGSQFIIATHSPILMAYPEATIYLFDASGISTVAYEDTEHYAITRAFLTNPKRMLQDLFAGLEDESD